MPTTRQPSTTRTTTLGRLTVLVMAVLLVCGALGGGLPTASAEPLAPPGPPPGARWDPKEALANGVIAKIGGMGLDLILNQVGMGDPTQAKLDEIKAELGRVHQHLDAMEDRLAHAIAMNHYSDEVHKTDHTRTQIENTFATLVEVAKQAFPVHDAQDALAKAKTDQEKAAAQLKLDAAMTLYRQRVTEFTTSYTNEHIADALGDLNKMLFPYAGADDLIVAYRNVILSDGDIRYLTKAHSDSVGTVYTYFEDYESLAAWMTGEYNAALKIDNTTLTTRFKGYVDTQRDKLPTPIPDGVVIDLGQHATTTRGKTMWMAQDGTYTWKSGDTQAPGVYSKIDEMNNRTKPFGLGGWSMPTQADMTQIFAKYAGGAPVDYLKSIGITRFTAGQFLWTGDVVDTQVRFYEDEITKYAGYQTRVAISLGATGIGSVSQPQLPEYAGDVPRSEVDRMVDDCFRAARGGMVAIRNTGTVDYL